MIPVKQNLTLNCNEKLGLEASELKKFSQRIWAKHPECVSHRDGAHFQTLLHGIHWFIQVEIQQRDRFPQNRCCMFLLIGLVRVDADSLEVYYRYFMYNHVRYGRHYSAFKDIHNLWHSFHFYAEVLNDSLKNWACFLTLMTIWIFKNQRPFVETS